MTEWSLQSRCHRTDNMKEMHSSTKAAACFLFLWGRKTKALLTGRDKSLGFAAHDSRFSPAYGSRPLFPQMYLILQDWEGMTAVSVSVSNSWEGSRDNLVLSDLSPFFKNKNDWLGSSANKIQAASSLLCSRTPTCVFANPCSHLIKQRLLCNLWVLGFPWQPHAARPRGFWSVWVTAKHSWAGMHAWEKKEKEYMFFTSKVKGLMFWFSTEWSPQ